MDQQIKYGSNVSVQINVYYVMRSIGYSYDRIVRNSLDDEVEEISKELRQMENKKKMIDKYLEGRKESIWKYSKSKYFGFFVNDIDDFINHYKILLERRNDE